MMNAELIHHYWKFGIRYYFLEKVDCTKKGKLLLSRRSTLYPCCVPTLGDSKGAGRKRLARHKGSKRDRFTKCIWTIF